MTNLSELSQYESGIYQLERTDPVDAGTNGDGVSNLQAKQLANRTNYLKTHVDDVEAEITAARNGEANLDARLDAMDVTIDALSFNSNDNAKLFALAQSTTMASGFPSFSKGIGYVINRSNSAKATGFSNSTEYDEYLIANPDYPLEMSLARTKESVIFVGGQRITLKNNLTAYSPIFWDMSAAPITGSRQDYVFIEVWEEEFTKSVADSVLFPYGCTDFVEAGTFDNCTLVNNDQTGGNYPAYLSSASTHGYYVLANDANIEDFISDPKNNIHSAANGKWYQTRWRIRIVDGVTTTMRRSSMDTLVKAQGQLAAPSTILFDWDKGIVGDVAVDGSLASDGLVYSIPLCIAHRRNSTAFSITNVNGAGSHASGISGRPDGKFHDIIDAEDVLDLRNRVAESFDYQSLFDETYQNIYNDHNTETMFENFLSDPDGNETYVDHQIFSKKPLQFEGISTNGFDSAWQVVRKINSNNGVNAGFDGLRSYYSDAPGTQTIVGRVDAHDVDGVTPTSIFTYEQATKTLTIDATDMNSNDGSNSYRTKVSNRTPEIMWDGSPVAGTPETNKVAITWSSLGTDTAVGVIDKGSTIEIVVDSANVVAGDTYTDSNSVTLTVINSSANGGSIYFYFEGNTIPVTGTLTQQSGTGVASLNATAVQNLGYTCTLDENNNKINVIDNGLGYDLHGSDGFFVNAFVDFREGSSVITYAPDGIENFLGSQWYHNGTQMLPEDGKGWIPFGLENDAELRPSYNKSVGLKGFVRHPSTYKGSGYVFKEGSTYYTFYKTGSGQGTNIYSSTDLENYTQIGSISKDMFASIGDATYSEMGNVVSIIKVNTTYYMLASVYETGGTLNNAWSLKIASSTDLLTWTPMYTLDGANGNIAGSCGSGCLYYENSKFKAISTLHHKVVLYEDSDINVLPTTGILKNSSIPNGVRCIIKENGIFKALCANYGGYDINLISSKDAVNWSSEIMILPSTSMNELTAAVNTMNLTHIMKDDNKYILTGDWANYSVAILTMTDDANTGSSTTGVYPTEGTLNCAPAPTDEVVFMYKHMAISPGDLDAMYSGTLKFENTHVHNAVITGMKFSDTSDENTHLNCALINQMEQIIQKYYSAGWYNGYGKGTFVLDRGLNSKSTFPRYNFTEVKTQSTHSDNKVLSGYASHGSNGIAYGKVVSSSYGGQSTLAFGEGITLYDKIFGFSNRLVIVDNSQVCLGIRSSGALHDELNYMSGYEINPMCVGRPLVKQS